ncbi:flagellar hook-length control protein FliK [Brevundimonas sp.]|uniref:flagellar hook-length control protein FliK n=2 Tax=Brevundimonas sp. TaxID=1871086 RepID=UPI002FCBBED2
MSASAILSVLPLGAPNGAAGFDASTSDNGFADLLGTMMQGDDVDVVSDNVAAPVLVPPPVPPLSVIPTVTSAVLAANSENSAEPDTSALPDSENTETPAQEPQTDLPVLAAPVSPLATAPVEKPPAPVAPASTPVPPAPATQLNLRPEVPLMSQLGTQVAADEPAPDATQIELPAPAPSAQDAEAAPQPRAQQVEATLRQTQNPQLQAATAAQALQAVQKAAGQTGIGQTSIGQTATGEFKSNAAAHRLDKGGNALSADNATTSPTATAQPTGMAASMAEPYSAPTLGQQTQTAASQTAPAAFLPADAAPDAQAVMAEVAQSANAPELPADNRLEQTRLAAATFNTTAEIAAQFVQKLGQRVARFDMVLTPETLGTVEIAMEVGADGDVKARMVFDTPAAANELRARAEELRRQLNEAGFQISENALEFTDRESDQRGGFQQFMSDGRSGRRAFAGSSRLAEMADAAPPPVWQSVSLTPSGVDIKV